MRMVIDFGYDGDEDSRQVVAFTLRLLADQVAKNGQWAAPILNDEDREIGRYECFRKAT